ncbi:MAG: hypothetical protein CSA75_00670, partial [Sorangium cellulosum]
TRFSGFSSRPGTALRVVVEYAGVPYASPLFRLTDGVGKRVPIQLFALTEDIDKARVGIQTFVYIEAQDHHLSVEQMFRFTNLSETTWRSDMLPVALPSKAEGVEVGKDFGPLELESVPGRGVIIRGVVPPGTSEVAFQYQVAYPTGTSADLRLGMPPRVGSIRLIAAVGSNIQVRMAGAGRPTTSRDRKGQKLLILNRVAQPGEDQLESVLVSLSGLPSIGIARWAALSLTLLAMMGGLTIALFQRPKPVTREQFEKRRVQLLNKFLYIEKNKSEGIIDENEYQFNREMLLDQLALVLDKSSDQQNSNT